MTDAAESPLSLIATYRLQLRPEFTLDDAAQVVPYLRDLGISHVYLSPPWQSVPGSTHGYDVIDHAKISPALGGLSSLYALHDVIREHGMGLVVDVVPNHVGIRGALHPWWRDVLRFGPASAFAPYFDIDWEGQPELPSGILVYPVLGQPFGATLEAGELSLCFDGTELVVRYYERASFPLAPSTYRDILGLPPPALRERCDDPATLQTLIDVLEQLPAAPPANALLLVARLAEVVNREAAVHEWIDAVLAALNGEPDNPASFDRLEAILRAQPYRLSSWRVSAEEINYRRFFDINELAAIRAEHPPVFEETHRLVREAVANGIVDGLRIDHVDGLYDPGHYLESLRQMVDEGPRPCRIWVEKILGAGEPLPPRWPIEGTTGYEMIALVGGLLTDPAGEQALGAVYREFTGAGHPYADVAFGARRRVAGRSFAGEVNVLALQLHRLAQEHRLHRDITLRALREAVAAVLACFPVYRTYYDEEHGPGVNDRDLILAAASEAFRRDPNVTREAVDYLSSVLLLDEDGLAPAARERRLHFRRRFQQISSPVMAKGVEDTTFFRYHRLLAFNEVGCHPDHAAVTPEEAHVELAERAAHWPLALSASTTHDTKRSEDARARLLVLSEMPRAWRREVRAWGRMNDRWRRTIDGASIPDRNTEYYLYQSLVAAWEGSPSTAFIERMQEHMTKAMREAKVATSWTAVNEAYEQAVLAFVRDILTSRRPGRFADRLAGFVDSIRPAEAMNALSALTLKCMAPGVPDFYLGSELPLHSLTDPDNRRPVEFAAHAASLAGETACLPEPIDPEAKQWLTRRLLRIRREHAAVFADGGYAPLEASGPMGAHVFAFARGHQIVAVVPRLAAAFLNRAGRIDPGRFVDTTISLPAAGAWVNALDGGRLDGAAPIAVAELLGSFPTAVLVRTRD